MPVRYLLLIFAIALGTKSSIVEESPGGDSSSFGILVLREKLQIGVPCREGVTAFDISLPPAHQLRVRQACHAREASKRRI